MPELRGFTICMYLLVQYIIIGQKKGGGDWSSRIFGMLGSALICKIPHVGPPKNRLFGLELKNLRAAGRYSRAY